MSFKNIEVIDPYVDVGMLVEVQLQVAAPSEVETVEAKLGTSLPQGYKEFVTTLGRGQYCSYIRVDMPSEIMAEYAEYQRLLDEYYFWELGEGELSKAKAIESIKIADTVDGDVIIFHPSKSDELFVLPRNDDMLYRIGNNLYEAIDWLCEYRRSETGSVGETHKRRYFVPWNRFVETDGWLIPKGI